MSLLFFRKSERLSKKKSIDRLFREGASFFVYPYKIHWLLTAPDSGTPAQVLISVGKRAFKRAVDRNKTKRQIRELYRLHKHELYDLLETRQKECLLGIIYTTGTHLPYDEMEKKIKAVFRRLFYEIDKKAEQ